MRKRLVVFQAALALTLLSGCAVPQQFAYPNEDFASTNTYAHSFPGSAEAACEAARRTLLSQGYVIGEAGGSQVRARKNFQPERDQHMQIEFHVVCAPNSKGSNSTTMFANAVREIYSLRKSSNSASLGVGSLGSVSLPFGTTDESLVKVGSETIPTRQFYARFFELVESYLDVSLDDLEDEAEKQRKPNQAPAVDPGKAEEGVPAEPRFDS